MAPTIPADPKRDPLGFPKEDNNGDGQPSGNGAATATAECAPGEQSEIWPELD